MKDLSLKKDLRTNKAKEGSVIKVHKMRKIVKHTLRTLDFSTLD